MICLTWGNHPQIKSAVITAVSQYKQKSRHSQFTLELTVPALGAMLINDSVLHRLQYAGKFTIRVSGRILIKCALPHLGHWHHWLTISFLLQYFIVKIFKHPQTILCFTKRESSGRRGVPLHLFWPIRCVAATKLTTSKRLAILLVQRRKTALAGASLPASLLPVASRHAAHDDALFTSKPSLLSLCLL